MLQQQRPVVPQPLGNFQRPVVMQPQRNAQAPLPRLIVDGAGCWRNVSQNLPIKLNTYMSWYLLYV